MLVSVRLEVVLILMQNRCTVSGKRCHKKKVSGKRTIGSELF
jgi:hypothetical protein